MLSFLAGLRNRRPRLVLLAAALLLLGGGWLRLWRGGPGADLHTAAKEFLSSLNEEQRAQATMKFDDPKRLDWHFIPKPERKGLQVKNMNPAQRKLAHELLLAGLSNLGYDKARTIMALEGILREHEKERKDGPIRDPERYYYTIFGEPGPKGTWGLSIEGHHLSLNFVVQDGNVSSTTPTFFGANPATVKPGTDLGPKAGTRVLEKEEDLGFALLKSLDEAQQKKAIVAPKAPADVRAAGEPHPPAPTPEGLSAKEMNEDQVKILWSLLEAYCANVPQEVGQARLDEAQAAGIENVYFVWAGATEPGVGHYYRVEGPTFAIEFVNTQPDAQGNIANHIHSQWRNTKGDFGLERK